MVWEVVAAAAVSSYAAHLNSAASASYWDGMAQIGQSGHHKAGPSLDEVAREHRAKMDAAHRETMRGARTGTLLLLALIVTAAYGVAQLAGLA